MSNPRYTIDVSAPMAAAKFIKANNVHFEDASLDYILQKIHRDIKWVMEKEEREYVGSAGWEVYKQDEGDGVFCIKVVVDPSVSQHTYYADVQDYLMQSGVV